MQAEFENNAAFQSVLATLEVERKKIASTKTKGYIFIGSGIAFGILGAVLGIPMPSILIGLGGVIYGGILLYRITEQSRAYAGAFKRDVIGSALKSLDQSLTIEPYSGIVDDEFVSSQLFTTNPDRYHTEDLVSGQAGKTRFYFAEVHAEYKTEEQTKDGRRVNWHEIFKGIIFVADFNKNFNGVTVVRPKGITAAFGVWFSKNIFSFGDKDAILLENPEFNKTFVTYGNDQVEARYILTPAMMDRIFSLNRKSASAISLSFINSRMYIAFPLQRNYFEAPVFKTLLNPALLNEDISVIRFMYDIVNELDLNTRIWGKN
ncbi:DUF3137 domain-containing protein [Pedobacter punctiformis]|uniref:DUF3137 domain-containing protein n=1 Tax=Pedobacter punctiformis TaxID=3004097 RepID=A0ABT4L587_9SPHI|nr:DUF3137 domain-containing protein [Pedobacter sp. HCMS5-2]MCZ4243098.1 DUF3137 domain-containing protein [Pedobacter sp. HCMS5-2]